MTKIYDHDGFAGCVQRRRAQQTGTTVGVYHAEQAGLDTDHAVPWYTVCEDHDRLVGHGTLALARSFAASPQDWCGVCNGSESGGKYVCNMCEENGTDDLDGICDDCARAISREAKQTVTPQTITRDAVAAYEKIVRANNSDEWNTIKAVGRDDTGEAFCELIDTAVEVTGLDNDTVHAIAEPELAIAFASLQAKFRAELPKPTLVLGQQYRVVRHGAWLEERTVHVHGGGSVSWTYTRQPLPIDAVITYHGVQHGPGSDSIDEAIFSYDESGRDLDGVRGSFHPGSWGSPDLSYLDTNEGANT